MIIQEDLNTLEELFKEKVGAVKDCVLRDGGVFIHSLIRPKSSDDIAPLEAVRIYFENDSSNPNKILVQMDFDVDEVLRIVTNNNPIMPMIDSLFDLSSKYDFNFFTVHSFKLSNWGVSDIHLTSGDNYITFEFYEPDYKKGKRIDYKLRSIYTYGDSSQFKGTYPLSQTTGGEISMKVFGEWLVSLVNSLIDDFKKQVSLPILLNEIVKGLKVKMLVRK